MKHHAGANAFKSIPVTILIRSCLNISLRLCASFFRSSSQKNLFLLPLLSFCISRTLGRVFQERICGIRRDVLFLH